MRKTITVMFVILSLAAIACRLGSTAGERPGPEIPVTTEDAKQLEDNLKSTTGATNGDVDLKITEEQLTSYVFYQLQQNPDTGITDPQVYLRDGKIQLYAKYTTSGIPIDVQMAITPQVSDGKITLHLDSVKLGPIQAPQSVIDQAQQIITDDIEPNLNQSVTGGLYVESLTIADGVLTVHGKKP